MNIDRITKTNKNFIGLSLTNSNNYHIKHDVTKPIELNDNTVDIYQSEDVFEHIEYLELNKVFNEIYRVLKPGGLFRLSIPDYKCDILQKRSLKDASGNIFHDPGGAGNYDFLNNKVINGGHVWFPNYNLVYYIF